MRDTHVYLSTACLHSYHAYCAAMTGQQGAKRPARCKFCDARCVCRCHDVRPPSNPNPTRDVIATTADAPPPEGDA